MTNCTNPMDALSLVQNRLCSGSCLVAPIESKQSCDCVCKGTYHGALSDALVEQVPATPVGFSLGDLTEDPRFCLLAGQVDVCERCNRRIKSRVIRWLTDTHVVLCDDCAFKSSRGHPHQLTHPDCPVQWHDIWDHPVASGTAAEVRVLKQLWPGDDAWRRTGGLIHHPPIANKVRAR